MRARPREVPIDPSDYDWRHPSADEPSVHDEHDPDSGIEWTMHKIYLTRPVRTGNAKGFRTVTVWASSPNPRIAGVITTPATSYRSRTIMSTARYETEAQQAAANELAPYVNIETLAPDPDYDIVTIVKAKMAATPGFDPNNTIEVESFLDAFRTTMMNRAKPGSQDRIPGGRVVLNINGDYRPGLAWQSNLPQIVFVKLRANDQGIHNAVGHQVAAAALYFDPQLVTHRREVVKRAGRPVVATHDLIDSDTGEILHRAGEFETAPNPFAEDGYIALLKTFDTLGVAKEAIRTLKQAVRTLATDPESEYEPDQAEDPVPTKGEVLNSL